MADLKQYNRQIKLINKFVNKEWLRIFAEGAGAILIELSSEDNYFNIVSLIGDEALCDNDVVAIHDYNILRKMEENWEDG